MSKYFFDNDFSADSLKWHQRREKSPDDTTDTELEEMQKKIIEAKDSGNAYFFAESYDYQMHKMQQVIIDNNDVKYAFLFAQNIPNSDIKTLQELVVKSNKIKYICKFACFVKGADRQPLEDIILGSDNAKNAKYAHMLLKHVKGSDVTKFKELILDSGKPRYLFELARHTKDPAEITRIEDLIIASKSFTYMRMFAEKIKQSNIDKIEQAVLDTDNITEIKKFAKYVKRSKMKKFFLVL